MERNNTNIKNWTPARVAPEGRLKAFAKKSPRMAKVTEKRTLKIKVCRTLRANLSAKKPGTNNKVSINTVPANFMEVTIKSEMSKKKR